MGFFMGVDGGGTKTAFVLADDAGRVLARASGPSCHYMQCGLDGLTRILGDGILDCLTHSGVRMEELTYAFIAMASFGDSASGDALVIPAVAKAFDPVPHALGNDSENGLAGALAGGPGINIVAGTGSTACGKNESGETARCGGWHHALGSDEGSAYWIVCRMFAEFIRQSDGRDAPTALHAMIKEKLALSSDTELITRVVEEWGLDRPRMAALAPVAAELYDMGDPYARRIIQDAAAELCDMAFALNKRLGLAPGARVSCTGGVFKMGERILSPIRERLAACGMKLVPPALQPDCGSVILAMQRAGHIITDEITVNLAEGGAIQ